VTAPTDAPAATTARTPVWARRLRTAAATRGAARRAPAPARAVPVAAPPTPSHTPSSTLPLPPPATGGRLRAWAELLRIPAVFTVPGDALAGAAATATAPGRSTALAVGASLCLYEAGMVLNDWADQDEDAAARPHRPLPSGRVRPAAALAAAGVLTAAGLALAARAGQRALAVSVPLAATIWAYDLKLKHTKAGPAAMAAARSLDLLLGAAATAGTVRPALTPAAILGSHTYAVTLVSRHEVEGGSTATPLAALTAATALACTLTRGRFGTPTDAVQGAMGAGYLATFGRPLAHAALNPSPALTQRAVGGGIRATIALQAGLMARAGAPGPALLTAALAPVAARLARKVSTT
jgi:hypothetical protein